MKKIFCITISLCLILGSVLPVYADWGDIAADRNNLNSIRSDLSNLYSELHTWMTSFTSGTWASFYDNFYNICTYIADGLSSPNSSLLTLYSMINVIAADLADYDTGWESMVTSIFQNTSNTTLSNTLLGVNNTYLDDLKKALTNYRPGETSTWSNFAQLYAQAHRSLFKIQSGTNALSSAYEFRYIGSSGSYTDPTYYWTYGSPIGNLANMFQKYNLNFVNSYVNRWSADLTHYNDQLSTWDSAGNNGNTLEQVLFTPESAIQGLYRYLAFTQRDVARLTFTLANEKDQQMRESTEDQQDQLYDSFLDPGDQSNPAASGRVSDSDIGDMGDLSAGFKDNMNTGVSASNVWSVFDSSRYNWFTQATKNSLDTVPATRDVYETSDYPTPLLDAYYFEMFSILGIEIDESR